MKRIISLIVCAALLFSVFAVTVSAYNLKTVGEIAEGTYIIVSSIDENKALDISGQNKENGTNVHLWKRHGGDTQKFKITKNGQYYKIVNVGTGKALDIVGNSNKSGANVHQWDVLDVSSQNWKFEIKPGGYVKIKSALGNYLDAYDGKADDGTNIQVYKSNGTYAQKWFLIQCPENNGKTEAERAKNDLVSLYERELNDTVRIYMMMTDFMETNKFRYYSSVIKESISSAVDFLLKPVTSFAEGYDVDENLDEEATEKAGIIFANVLNNSEAEFFSEFNAGVENVDNFTKITESAVKLSEAFSDSENTVKEKENVVEEFSNILLNDFPGLLTDKEAKELAEKIIDSDLSDKFDNTLDFFKFLGNMLMYSSIYYTNIQTCKDYMERLDSNSILYQKLEKVVDRLDRNFEVYILDEYVIGECASKLEGGLLDEMSKLNPTTTYARALLKGIDLTNTVVFDYILQTPSLSSEYLFLSLLQYRNGFDGNLMTMNRINELKETYTPESAIEFAKDFLVLENLSIEILKSSESFAKYNEKYGTDFINNQIAKCENVKEEIKSYIEIFENDMETEALDEAPSTSSNDGSGSLILQRIEELKSVFISGNNRYFTANGNGCALTQKSGSGYIHNSCSNCLLSNVVNSTWFNKAFGFAPGSGWNNQASSTYSCKAFADFAHWYIFRTDNSTPITTSRISGCNNVSITKENFAKLKVGDWVQVRYNMDKFHYFIFLGLEGETVRYIDANGNNAWSTKSGTKNGCVVDINTRKVSSFASSYNVMTARRADNYDAISDEEETVSVQYDTAIANGKYYLVNNGYRLNMLADKQQRNSINVSNASKNANMEFTFTKDGNYYKIIPTHTVNKMVLNAFWNNNKYTADGDEITLYSNTDDPSQRWYFEKYGNGYLVHPGDNASLSLTRDTSTNKVYVKTTTKASNQIWTLESSTHEHSYEYACDTAHPHKQYRTCSCGLKEYTGNEERILSCNICNPEEEEKPTESNLNDMIIDFSNYSNSGKFKFTKYPNDDYTVTHNPSAGTLDVIVRKKGSQINLDPAIIFSELKFDAEDYKYVIINAKIEVDCSELCGMQVFFTTNKESNLSEGKSNWSYFTPSKETGYRDFVFDMSQKTTWTGEITSVRVDPFNDYEGDCFIKSIKFTNSLPSEESTASTDHRSVMITLPKFDVTINGKVKDNSYANYPYIIYNDITYFPMTYKGARFLGLECNWTKESGLEIKKNSAAKSDVDDNEKRSTKNEEGYTARVASGEITVNGKKIDNSAEEYPILIFRDVTYFPLTWRFAVTEFGWDYNFTTSTGLVINSK